MRQQAEISALRESLSQKEIENALFQTDINELEERNRTLFIMFEQSQHLINGGRLAPKLHRQIHMEF